MREGVLLLVEDNEDDVELTLRALSKNRIANEIVIARDGVEALDYLFGRGAHAGRDVRVQPAVVLLDLKLPRIDGLEVLAQVRADPRTQATPIVILTSSAEESDIATGYRRGGNSYIRKPVDFDEFIRAMGQVGMYWLLLNVRATSST
jgi:two-component system response regulator